MNVINLQDHIAARAAQQAAKASAKRRAELKAKAERYYRESRLAGLSHGAAQYAGAARTLFEDSIARHQKLAEEQGVTLNMRTINRIMRESLTNAARALGMEDGKGGLSA